MGIEKDINQSKFKNEYQKSIINLTYTYNWVTEQIKEVLQNWDLTSQQFNILRILRGSHAPLSTLQIRERMLDKMSDTSRIVDRLLIKNLVKKVPCKSDKRLVDITITAKGQKILTAIDKEEEKMDSIAKMLSVADAKLLNKLLDKMRGSN
jgi:MarR family 2-MHQ and catechol resistance regulon transcriptional repressor